MTAPQLVAKVKNLPPVPHAALRLVNLLDQPAISNEDIVQVLKSDTVLTAKLLRACNSPYFGLDEPVSSVDQAVLMLGHQQILHIVLTLAFGGAMTVPLPGFATEANELWQHSLNTAVAAEMIAGRESELEADATVAFTAGLLHDIGKLIIAQVLKPEMKVAIQNRMGQGNTPRVEAELEVVGTDHSEVGACLLGMWRVPEEIVEAVANHHRPVLEPVPRMSVTTHIANSVAHLVSRAPGEDPCVFALNERVASQFAITPEKLESMVVAAREATERTSQFSVLA